MKRIGILLTNLGTPSAPTPSAVRHYLKEFLSDRRVVELPRLPWWFILNALILPLRSYSSARKYQKIWQAEGSPLLINSKMQAVLLEQELQKHLGTSVTVVLAMRYGTPSIEEGLNRLQQLEVDHLLLFPLYPQYSASTTASTFDAVARVLKHWRHIPSLRMITHYEDDAGYIAALSASIKSHWNKHGTYDHLLFSFHGLPQRCVKKGDPYQAQCYRTAELVADKLSLTPDNYSIVFQSRFGKEKWLEPYCDKTLAALPAQGKKNVAVICPGFSVDCLETLEEIMIQNQEIFKKAGGESFHYIPALNYTSLHIEALANLVLRHIQEWITQPAAV